MLFLKNDHFQALDLFNFLLTDEADLRNFLGTNNCDEADKVPSLIIKSYLKFCSATNTTLWHEDTVNDTYEDIFASTEDIEDFTREPV